ncbi:MAG: ABC transporter substrate-binding protein [Candidatus Thorarchaeota archaeon]
MTKKRKLLIFWAINISILTGQLLATTTSGAAYERPVPYFKLELLAPTNLPSRVLTAQVIAREFWKIGIDVDLRLIGWNGYLQRIQDANWEVRLVGLYSVTLDEYHSSKSVYINSTTLDRLLDHIAAEPDFEKAHESVLRALNITVWGHHAGSALYQQAGALARDAALQGPIPTGIYPSPNNYPRLFFEDDKQSELIRVVPSRFTDLNQAFQGTAYDKDFSSPVYSYLYEPDAEGIQQPILAAGNPIPLSSMDPISKYIDLTQVSADSRYYGTTPTSLWGPNPNIDALQYNATVSAANCSMFLIRLREGMPWHPGYGYTESMKLNVTADDLLWTFSYYMDDDIPQRYGHSWERTWGTDYRRAIEKINETMVKVNFCGALGNGIEPRWRTWFSSSEDVIPLPRHILDPTFDARLYGGGIGVTPDGTTILPYAEQECYRYNTGEGQHPLPGTGPYYLEQWDEIKQLATYRKFDSWGGYGDASLWTDARFQQNNIETIGIEVRTNKYAAILDLEVDKVDLVPFQFIEASDVAYLARQPSIRLDMEKIPATQGMLYFQWGPKLNNRYVRLAISHIVPRQRIVSYILGGLGKVNDVWLLELQDPHYPTPEEWKTIGLPKSENVEDPDTGKELKFQGHIRYSPDKAWALMEKAGYDMTPFRETLRREETGERADPSLEPLPLLVASGVTVAIVGAALVLSRYYWESSQLARDPAALKQNRQRKQVMAAIKLKQSSRMGKKAKAQDLFQQLAKDETLAPELTIYVLLNLCDLLIDEVKAYGERAVFLEAERLSLRIHRIAQEQQSDAMLVEALLMQSKFKLLEGNLNKVDKLLAQAATVAEEKQLRRYMEKVAMEQSAMKEEYRMWQTMIADAAPLRERLQYARLQDYIASAVRVIEQEKGISDLSDAPKYNYI